MFCAIRVLICAIVLEKASSVKRSKEIENNTQAYGKAQLGNEYPNSTLVVVKTTESNLR